MALRKNPKVDLKRQYSQRIQLALILALTCMISAVMFVPDLDSEIVSHDYKELVVIEEVPATIQGEMLHPDRDSVVSYVAIIGCHWRRVQILE